MFSFYTLYFHNLFILCLLYVHSSFWDFTPQLPIFGSFACLVTFSPGVWTANISLQVSHVYYLLLFNP